MTAMPRQTSFASPIRGRIAHDLQTELEKKHDWDARTGTTGSDSTPSALLLSPACDPCSSRTWRIRQASDDMAQTGSRSRRSASGPGSALDSRHSPERPSVLDEFTAAWERGEAPAVEEYLDRLAPADSQGAVELIYREFCLAEAAGDNPDPSSFLSRFPQHEQALDRLLQLHGECSPSLLGGWVESASAALDLPGVGDAIGSFVLRRELGRGSFARVFLAEQTDLENRPVVVKISTRPTREPWLLARARHANIVEIVTHATVNDGDYQLICMPFWGGATLAAVLAVGRKRERRPVSGRDLLADLDSVAAPEYPAVQPTRPAREILAGLSYGQAVAWVVARLAEALDHAFSRDVAHGDIKPSNILLSADANPMLLDFNLARDGSPAGSSWSDNDPGGTLAYMAPERLWKLATADPTGEDSRSGRSFTDRDTHSNASPTQASDLLDRGPHLADIYALGMVLLEALTARPPEQVTIADDLDPASSSNPVKTAATAYSVIRARSARALIRESESAGGRTIPAGLRAILERCLDPDPARRYRRAWELAEDLNRWRTDRPLAFAAEPFWRQTVPRCLRRQRRTLVLTAVALSLLVALSSTAFVLYSSQLTGEEKAQDKLSRLWDNAEAGAYRPQRPGTRRVLNPGDPEVVATALRALKEYNVVGPDNCVLNQDWRQDDDVRLLSKSDREDLELWLMEQAYRYCRGLDDRPDQRKDWRRALEILGHVGSSAPPQSFSALSRRLRAKLREVTLAPLPVSSGASAAVPPWLDQYLLGVAAECDVESESPNQTERPLEHYSRVLALRPDSFWGHYRAAAALYGLDRFDEALSHLGQCLKRRPDNSVLVGQRASCLMELNRFDEALNECDRAIERAPDYAELLRSRAFIRTAVIRKQRSLDQFENLAEDIRRFELLSQRLPRSLWGNLPLALAMEGGCPAGSPSLGNNWTTPTSLDVDTRLGKWTAELEAEGKNREVDVEDLNARAVLASSIRQTGEFELAASEYEKILILNPDHISVWMMQALQAIESRQFELAKRDLDTVLGHPGLVEYLRKNPECISSFRGAIRGYLVQGKFEEAQAIGRRTLNLAIAHKLHRGEIHYELGYAYATAGANEPRFIKEAAEQLFCAFVANDEYINRYKSSESFNPVRAQIDRALESEMHRRGRSIRLSKVP